MSSVLLLLLMLMNAQNAVLAFPESMPVLRMTPNVVFEGDDVHFLCTYSSDHPFFTFAFYKNGYPDNNIYGFTNASLEDTGYYYCATIVRYPFHTVMKLSNIQYIQVHELFFTPVLRVPPYPAVEEDVITLSCDTLVTPYRPYTLLYTFYRDGTIIQGPGLFPTYTIHVARLTDSGTYRCEVSSVSGQKSSQEERIQIQERFSSPKMDVFPNPVVEGDFVTLTCATRLNPLRENIYLQFVFYRNGEKIQGPSVYFQYKFQLSHQGNSENYYCEVFTGNGERKISQKEYFQNEELFSTPKMGVTPNPAVEGESMTMTCDTRLSRLRRFTDLEIVFYRDGRRVQGPGSSKQYELKAAHLWDSGTYNCEVSARDNVKKSSQKEYVQIQGIFSTPKIQVNRNPVVEGDNTTLTCDTNPYRNTTELQFTFYREGRRVQGPQSSKEYSVPNIQVKDLGNYKCEISTTNGVKKLSQERYIPVEELFPYPNININVSRVVEGDPMTLTCDTRLNTHRQATNLTFTFYRDEEEVQEFGSSNTYYILSARAMNSGNYSCKASAANTETKESQKKCIRVEVTPSTGSTD